MPTASTAAPTTASVPVGKPSAAAVARLRGDSVSTLRSGEATTPKPSSVQLHAFTELLDDSVYAMEQNELESCGEDVKLLQERVSQQQNWLKKLHEAGAKAATQYSQYMEQVDERLQSRNRRLADAMAAAADANAAKRAAEIENAELKSRIDQAQTAVNKATPVAHCLCPHPAPCLRPRIPKLKWPF